MALATTKCDYCGKEIKRQKTLINRAKHHFCDKFCYAKYIENHPSKRVKHPGKRQLNLYKKPDRIRPKEVNACYLKEARAILHGKHWEGKNKCVKLKGD